MAQSRTGVSLPTSHRGPARTRSTASKSTPAATSTCPALAGYGQTYQLVTSLLDPATAPAIHAFADALGADDPAARVEELSALFGAGRLRDHGVPEEDLPEVAELSAARPATQVNPRPVSADDALTILRSVW